ncbi:hypothetical protein [Roseateles sp.]|jgi:hypothetical protein|uniref:hypothetical protein n=1 Tax=Roseateles sp. TaxID=1971397 RepID=UPI0031E2D5CF
MTTVFIAGSIGLKHLDRQVLERIERVVQQDFDIVVGDADGVDAAAQRHLLAIGATRVTVYCAGDTPRQNLGDWPVGAVASPHARGSRAFFAAKDRRMAELADYGLMVWDARSTGTLANILEMLERRKKSAVFVNKLKAFENIGNADQLEALVARMSDSARRRAEEKLQLSDRLLALRHEQQRMFG